MSRPLHLRTSEKAACFSWWWLSTFSNGGICEVINNGINYAIVRWTCCRPLWDENMMNCYVRKGPWTGVRWSSWCRTHCGCRFDWFECLVSCILRCLYHCSSMFRGKGVVPSEGPCFTTLSHSQCCARGVRSLATWKKEGCTDLQKSGEALYTRSACKRSLWCQFISCRVSPCKSNMSRRVTCSVSSRPFHWRLATETHP